MVHNLENIDFESDIRKTLNLGEKMESIAFGSKMLKTLICGYRCGKYRFWVKNEENIDFGQKMWKTKILGQNIRNLKRFFEKKNVKKIDMW